MSDISNLAARHAGGGADPENGGFNDSPLYTSFLAALAAASGLNILADDAGGGYVALDVEGDGPLFLMASADGASVTATSAVTSVDDDEIVLMSLAANTFNMLDRLTGHGKLAYMADRNAVVYIAKWRGPDPQPAAVADWLSTVVSEIQDCARAMADARDRHGEFAIQAGQEPAPFAAALA